MGLVRLRLIDAVIHLHTSDDDAVASTVADEVVGFLASHAVVLPGVGVAPRRRRMRRW
ncbi:MAG: hypothetical protein U0Q15_19270 [Kineosporiaceae bacterium]